MPCGTIVCSNCIAISIPLPDLEDLMIPNYPIGEIADSTFVIQLR